MCVFFTIYTLCVFCISVALLIPTPSRDHVEMWFRQRAPPFEQSSIAREVINYPFPYMANSFRIVWRHKSYDKIRFQFNKKKGAKCVSRRAHFLLALGTRLVLLISISWGIFKPSFLGTSKESLPKFVTSLQSPSASNPKSGHFIIAL